MNELYPLKFKPVFKDKIWGGQKIRTRLGLDFSPLPNCGEAWILSGVEGSQTTVSNGFLEGNELNELVEVYMDDLVGEKVFARHRNTFPILVKFIDSSDYLSIQVHPDDELAARRNLGNGKSEMWYILDADKDAELITGFSREVSQKTYLDHLKANSLKEILNVEKVSAGDVFYIPSGRVHALGPGILLAEIQQTSDTTYRIYDWGRRDEKGNSRELHTDLALEAIDFRVPPSYRTRYSKGDNKTSGLVTSPHFITNLITFSQPVNKDYSLLDSFVLYICVEGAAKVSYDSGSETLSRGEAMLLPAMLEEFLLIPEAECKILEVFIP
ncbi:MAG TPA: type I phosphomannose isomerase catalytic subunit [Bacteroidales bacterium]|nr:type I phosphomannose isomerase catalytic subunit [Bacteroidales bacterium]